MAQTAHNETTFVPEGNPGSDAENGPTVHVAETAPQKKRARRAAAVLPPPRLVSPQGAASMLAVGYDQVLELIHAGELPVVDMPGRRNYLIDVADIEAFIEQRKSNAGIVRPRRSAEPDRPAPREKVGIKVGINSVRKARKVAESGGTNSHPKKAKKALNPLWYLEFRRDD